MMIKNLLFVLLTLSASIANAQTNKEAKKDTIASVKSDVPDEELEPVDEPAEYPGGMEAFTTYISRKLKFPEQARLDHISGKVLVSFVVQKNGALGDVKIVKSLTKETDAEAIRLIQTSKPWKPAKIGRAAAKQRFTQSITFSPPED